MPFLKNLIRKIPTRNPDSPAARRDRALSACGKHIKYVTEKIDDVEQVVGRSGSLAQKGEDFLVFASGEVLFRCEIDRVQVWELLSRNGVVITGEDRENGGRERTLVAYYVYHRK